MDEPKPLAFTLESHFAFQLNRTWNSVAASFAETYALGIGLKRVEWYALLAVREGATSQPEIARMTGLVKVPVSRAVVALEKLALLKRSVKRGPARYCLTLTSKGSFLVGQSMAAACAKDARLFREFSQDEIVQLRSLLIRLQQAGEED